MVFDPRSKHAIKVDKALSAPTVPKEKWKTNRDEFDLAGYDTPASKKSGTSNRPFSTKAKVRKHKDKWAAIGKKDENLFKEEFEKKSEAKKVARKKFEEEEGRSKLTIESKSGDLISAFTSKNEKLS